MHTRSFIVERHAQQAFEGVWDTRRKVMRSFNELASFRFDMSPLEDPRKKYAPGTLKYTIEAQWTSVRAFNVYLSDPRVAKGHLPEGTFQRRPAAAKKGEEAQAPEIFTPFAEF